MYSKRKNDSVPIFGGLRGMDKRKNGVLKVSDKAKGEKNVLVAKCDHFKSGFIQDNMRF